MPVASQKDLSDTRLSALYNVSFGYTCNGLTVQIASLSARTTSIMEIYTELGLRVVGVMIMNIYGRTNGLR